MLRVIKYVLDTKTLGLNMCPSGEPGDAWTMTCFTDSDWANDPETRRSVSGYVIMIHGVPICWRSKAQRAVTLSSTEAEWYALAEATKDILFLKQAVESMGLKIVLPIIVRVDNIGAIFMSENVSATAKTKHVDIRSKFVKEFCEDGVLKIVFVRSEWNTSDIMTKNLRADLHARHAAKLVGDK